MGKHGVFLLDIVTKYNDKCILSDFMSMKSYGTSDTQRFVSIEERDCRHPTDSITATLPEKGVSLGLAYFSSQQHYVEGTRLFTCKHNMGNLSHRLQS